MARVFRSEAQKLLIPKDDLSHSTTLVLFVHSESMRKRQCTRHVSGIFSDLSAPTQHYTKCYPRIPHFGDPEKAGLVCPLSSPLPLSLPKKVGFMQKLQFPSSGDRENARITVPFLFLSLIPAQGFGSFTVMAYENNEWK